MSSERKTIIELIHSFILSIMENRFEETESFLAGDVEFCSMKDASYIIGKKNFISFLKNTFSSKKILRYDEEDFTTHIENKIATASYRFLIEYEVNNNKKTESGRDFFLLEKHNNEWKIKWRSVYYFQ